MSFAIVSTKLYMPPPREKAVSRSKLIEKILAGIDRHGGFSLISGPAGFGKTSLLSAAVSKMHDPVGWVSLDEGDNDPIHFWTYLISAVQTVWANVGEELLERLGGSNPLPEESAATMLINDISKQKGSLVLVLDDYHEINNASIHASLLFLLEHLPHNLHLILSTRIDPPWPLGRFRARNQLTEIRTNDLRFSLEEARAFLNHTMGLDLSVEDAAALEARTEGWAAGLQLAALSMQGRGDIPAFVKSFSGSHQYVADYLVEEILKQQPEDIQSFLLKTSILERLNVGLCEAVSGCQDGGAILTTLQRANIFLIPLDTEGRWFRYHHLFADLLQARLQQNLPAEEIARLRVHAADWYEGNGSPIEAMQHSLAAEDFERAADLVRRFAPALIASGRIKTLRDWLKALPQITFQAHPQLSFYQFWIDVLQNKADLSEKAIQKMEDLLKELPATPENDRLRGELMAVVSRAVALSNRTSEGIRLAQEALAYLPADSSAARARTLSALASAHDLEGRAEQAEPAYQESYSLALAAGDLRLAAHTMMMRGLIRIPYGQLHEAAKTFQKIIDMAPTDQEWVGAGKNVKGAKAFLPSGQGYIGLGCIHLERNELEIAENYLEKGMDLCRQGELDGIFIAKVRMSRLRQAKGDIKGALEELQISQQAQRVDHFNLVTRQIRIALSEGDVTQAMRLAAPMAKMLEGEPDSIQMPIIFLEILEAVIARVYLAQGEFEKTLQLLERIQASAGPRKRAERLIEAHLIRALVYQKKNEGNPTPEAIQSFLEALGLGEPEGYVLLFLEEGAEVIPLLQAVVNRSSAPARLKEYASKILKAFEKRGESGVPETTGMTDELVEQLTRREMEVLKLLAAGDSNQAIADKLVITVRTVKKHASNIYGKLNVDSRTQAVARAYELGLLSPD